MSWSVSHDGESLALDGELLPGLHPLVQGPPGCYGTRGPNPEDCADSDEERHEVLQQERPEQGFLLAREPFLPVVVFVADACEDAGCGDDVQGG